MYNFSLHILNVQFVIEIENFGIFLAQNRNFNTFAVKQVGAVTKLSGKAWHAGSIQQHGKGQEAKSNQIRFIRDKSNPIGFRVHVFDPFPGCVWQKQSGQNCEVSCNLRLKSFTNDLRNTINILRQWGKKSKIEPFVFHKFLVNRNCDWYVV